MLDLSSILEAIRRIRPDMLQGILGQGGGGPSAGMGIPGYSPGMFGPPQGTPLTFDGGPAEPMTRHPWYPNGFPGGPLPFDPKGLGKFGDGARPPYEVTTLPAQMPDKDFGGVAPGQPRKPNVLKQLPARMPGKDFAGAMPPRSSASSGIGPGATTQAQSPEQQAYFRRLQKLGISDPTKGARLAQNRPNSVLGRMYSKANPARRGS